MRGWGRVAATGRTVAWIAAATAITIIVALVAGAAVENIRDRDRLFDALRDRNRAAVEDARRDGRRIDRLVVRVGSLAREVQALREQVIELGAVPVTITTTTTTTTPQRPRQSTTTTPTTRSPPPSRPSPPRAPPTTRPCHTLLVIDRCVVP